MLLRAQIGKGVVQIQARQGTNVQVDEPSDPFVS
jgi:hypothetical protein